MAKKSKLKEEVTEECIEQVDATNEETEVVDVPKEKTPEEIIEDLKKEVASIKNEMLKQHADLDNTKKRLEKERILERKYAGMGFAKHLLMPMDNFELALAQELKDETLQSFVQGFEMIKSQLTKALEEEGVSEIDALNEDYDPNFHQAIMTEKIEGTEANKVIQVLQKGYMFKDRLIRPAIVKISE